MKKEHDFKNGKATVNEFRRVVGMEWMDEQDGEPIYVRKVDTGCWFVAHIVHEDSGWYIVAGESSNPQEPPTETEPVEDAVEELVH